MTYRTQILAVLCLFSVVLASAPILNAAAPTYTVAVIGPFSRQGIEAVAVNSWGHVTGEGAGNQLFLYDGSLHLLGKPAGSTFAVGQGGSH